MRVGRAIIGGSSLLVLGVFPAKAQLAPPAAEGPAVPAPVMPAATAAAGGSNAAPAPVDGVGDIVVTARRTSERLQDVPVAVTALGAGAIAQRSIATLDQVAPYVPNIRFDGAAALSGGNYNATVFIRGVGQNDFAIFSDPGVGIYVDDVYYARSIGGILDAVDIDSVQVLRGPQGTLFGKNTIGGAMLITTAAPSLAAVAGAAEVTTGSYSRIDGKAMINVPLVTDRLALRLSGATIHRDGYVRRLIGGEDQGNRNSNMIRAKLRFAATEALTIDLGADYTRAREHSAPNKLLAVGNAPGLTGIPYLANYNRDVAPTRGIVSPTGSRLLDASYLTADPFTTYATGPNYNDLDLYGFQGTVRADLGGAELKSITAYRNMHASFARDGDNTPFTYRQTTNDDRQWQISEELQLSGKLLDDRLSYVIGGFLFKEKASDIATADLAIGLTPPLATTPPYTPAAFIFNYTNNRSVAAYGQVDFALTRTLSLTAGGRYSKDYKRFHARDVFQRNNLEYVNVSVKDAWSDFTPRLGINFKPRRNILLYGSYAKGFKQGGFNGRPLVGPQEVTSYEPETLTTFEGGVKAATADNALSANLAVFHSLYRNIQLTVNQTPTNFVANAARGKIDGFELELAARPAGWFTANASLGHIDARYTSVGQGLGPTQILPITLASKFVKTPRWTVSGGAELSHAFADGSRASLRADVTRYSRIYNDVANTPLITEPGYTLVNARAGYRFLHQRVEAAVFVTNLTDARYFVSGNASAGFGLAEVAYGRPREWGASLGYRF